ncbi:hypothetical protein AC578_4659 [Pseudocercospora eumusae]|uniref:Uncharacterized protein n=1 Tax=Pseudocercospora eumusae TaxID=321146 RepID=A0A139H7E0_9PEZI|nr:hypothetical protein AC578_4659 [Pseudocercospora eumusae]
MAQSDKSIPEETKHRLSASMKGTMSPAENVESTPTAVPDGSSTQEPTREDESSIQTAIQDNSEIFPLLSFAGELRNKLYEQDVATHHSTIHLVQAIGAFRQSPFAALNKQIRKEYLGIADDTCSDIEAVVRNLDFSHVIEYINNLSEIAVPKAKESCAAKSSITPAQTDDPSAAPKTDRDTASPTATSATKDTLVQGKTQWSEAALPRNITIKLVFSRPAISKRTTKKATAVRTPAPLTLWPQAKSAQSQRWQKRLVQWKEFIATEPKVAKLNFTYQAKSRMPFQMVCLKIWGWPWEGKAKEEGVKISKALEQALGRDTSSFYQNGPEIEASDEEDDGGEEEGKPEETPAGGPGPESCGDEH